MKAYQGYQKFKASVLPNVSSKLEKLANGQSPHTLFITCSDSRICPNLMTQTEFGELFVVRNAGNTVASARVEQADADKATLEYAIKVLKVKEIVVCGHSKCGAIAALLDGVDPESLPNVHNYLQRLSDLKQQAHSQKMDVFDAVVENVKMQIKNLLSYDFIHDALEEKSLKIYGWCYHIESGEVEVVEEIASVPKRRRNEAV